MQYVRNSTTGQTETFSRSLRNCIGRQSDLGGEFRPLGPAEAKALPSRMLQRTLATKSVDGWQLIANDGDHRLSENAVLGNQRGRLAGGYRDNRERSPRACS